MHIDIAKLEKDISFLRDEARRLRESQGKAQWALAKANRFDGLADFLVGMRRDVQMTGIGGKRIE